MRAAIGARDWEAARVRVALMVEDQLVADVFSRALNAAGFFDIIGARVASELPSEDFIDPSVQVAILALPRATAFPLVWALQRRDPPLPVLVLDRLGTVEHCTRGPVRYLDIATVGWDGFMDALLMLVPSTHPAPPPLRLTRREQEVLAYVAAGLDNLKIAALMGIGERAVKLHVTSLFRKLQCENRTELALRALQIGVDPLHG